MRRNSTTNLSKEKNPITIENFRKIIQINVPTAQTNIRKRQISRLSSRMNKKVILEEEALESSRTRKRHFIEKEETKIPNIDTNEDFSVPKESNNHFSETLDEIEYILTNFKSKVVTKKTNKPKQDQNNEEIEENDEESPKKSGKKGNTKTLRALKTPRIKRKTSKTTKTKLFEKIKEIEQSEEKLEDLRKRIKEYEDEVRKNRKNFNKDKKNFMKNNLNRIKNYSKEKQDKQKKFSQKRKSIAKSVKKKRKGIIISEIMNLKELEQEIIRKQKKSMQILEVYKELMKDCERQQKLGYIIVFISRFLLLKQILFQKRIERKEIEKRKQLKLFVSSKMMPFIELRRRKNWKEARLKFRNYFSFFKLWINIKKKKNSVAIIKSFLKDSNSALKLVRQVHLFSHRIRNTQFFLKKYLKVEESRVNVLLFKYIIKESLYILSNCISSSGSLVNYYKPLNPAVLEKFEISQIKNLKLKSILQFLDDSKNLDNSMNMCSYLCFLVPSVPEKIKIIKKLITKKLKNFENEQEKFKTLEKEYLLEKQKRDLDQKIKNIWGKDQKKKKKKGEGNEDDDEEGRDEDEDGEFKKPRKPILKIFVTENELDEIIVTELQNIKEKETEIFSDNLVGNISEEEFLKKIDQIEADHVAKCGSNEKNLLFLKEYFPDLFKKNEQLFGNCAKILSKIRDERKRTYFIWKKARDEQKQEMKKIKEIATSSRKSKKSKKKKKKKK